MDIVVWLRSLGLGKYEAAFRENEIDETVLVEPDGRAPPKSLASRLGIGSSCSMPLLRFVVRRGPLRYLRSLTPSRAGSAAANPPSQ